MMFSSQMTSIDTDGEAPLDVPCW